MKKILILEDDQLLAKTLVDILKTTQIDVQAVHTLKDFYQKIENYHFDLCIMDRLIGCDDSLLAGEYVKDILPEVKILFLSKKGQIRDRVEGLETGADDYLSKPFSLAELKLRARSLLAIQRSTQLREQIMIGELLYYPNQGIIKTPERKIVLRRREMEIWNCLVRAAGATVSRRQLILTLWPISYEPNPSTIDVYVRRLRQKLGVYSFMLQTRRGFGYRLAIVNRKL